MKNKEWLEGQIEHAKSDANKRVSKGSDLGVIAYTRTYIWVGGSMIIFMLVVTKASTYLDMRDPLQGIAFTAVTFWAFWKLCKYFDDES